MSESHPPGAARPNPPQWMATAPGPPAPRGRNGLAVAALILGILGVCGLSLILGLVLGVVALVQINRTGQAGRGMAIAGIIISLLWVAALTIGVIHMVNKAELSGTTPTLVGLKKGECYTKPPAFGQDAAKASCTAPHDGEVFATFTLEAAYAGYPGERTLENQAKSGCESRRTTTLGAGFTPPVEAAVAVFYPDAATWEAGNHHAVCTLQVTSDQKLTGPLRR